MAKDIFERLSTRDDRHRPKGRSNSPHAGEKIQKSF